MPKDFSGGETCEPNAQELLRVGRARCEVGDAGSALAALRRAWELDQSNAQIRSFYGLAVGLVERRFEQAADLCQSAVKQEFYNPDLYLNLSRLHLAFGFKSEGLRYLRRGQMIDPGHAVIATELVRLGERLPPVLGFFPRRHVLNRWLGYARWAIRRGTIGREQTWPRGRRPRGAALTG